MVSESIMGGNLEQSVTEYTYNEFGLVSKVTMPNGLEYNYVYDSNTLDLIKVYANDGTVLTENNLEYQQGLVLKMAHKNNIGYKFGYDQYNLLNSVKTNFNGVEGDFLTLENNITQTVDTYVMSRPVGYSKKVTVDVYGHQIKSEYKEGTQSYATLKEYYYSNDKVDDILNISDPLDSSLNNTGNSKLRKEVDKLTNNVKKYYYNTLGLVKKIENSSSTNVEKIEFEYDSQNRLLKDTVILDSKKIIRDYQYKDISNDVEKIDINVNMEELEKAKIRVEEFLNNFLNNVSDNNLEYTINIIDGIIDVNIFGKDAGFDMTPPNLIGFSIKLPLFSSGLYGSQISAAKIDYHKMQNTIADTKEALLVQDKQLRYNLRSALEDYSTQKENIDVSKRVFESIGKKYEHGTASSLDLTNASTSLITAQTNYLQSVIALVKAQVELENLLNN
mgnify:CR=1 FL=1